MYFYYNVMYYKNIIIGERET